MLAVAKLAASMPVCYQFVKRRYLIVFHLGIDDSLFFPIVTESNGFPNKKNVKMI